MGTDMKRNIAEAARTLLLEKNVKKLTVKDIVDECKITRQAFYYHFADIPEMFRWILEQDTEHLLREMQEQEDPEKGFRFFFLVAVNAEPYVKKLMQTNYKDELEHLLEQYVYRMFETAIETEGLHPDGSCPELKLVLRYHSQAILGILRGWTKEDMENLDEIVHQIYLLMKSSVAAIPDITKQKN